MRESSIPLYRPHVPQAASAALDEVLQSGQIAGDGNLPEFETKLREFLGVSHLVLTAEFSRFIEMALRMAGVGPGDLVLTSPLACLATTMPILQTGARPVWCDVDAETGNFLTRMKSHGGELGELRPFCSTTGLGCRPMC